MARTEIKSHQIKNGSIQIEDLDQSTVGHSVIAKVQAGQNITISSTGADDGTGIVTINASVGPTDIYKHLFI